MVVVAVTVAWIRLLPLSLVRSQAEQTARVQARAKVAAASSIDKRRSTSARVSDRQIDDWISAHRGWFDHQRRTVAARLESNLTYRGDDGERHVYLGDFDSYHWLRMARNYLRRGTTCDELSGGVCRDAYTNAPVGRQNIYARSLHIAAIVLVSDIATKFRPGYPLAASSFLVPVILGVIGVFPAFAIGRALAGNLGGFVAAILVSLNPLFLDRTIGSDDDVWNIILPLAIVWAIVAALRSRRSSRRIAYSLVAAIFAALHASSWQGWSYVYLVVLAGLAIAVMAELARYLLTVRSREGAKALARTSTVAIVFYAATGLLTLPVGYDGYTLPLTMAWRFAWSWLEAHAHATPHGLPWPQTLATVAELAPMKLREIVAAAGGPMYFSAAYAGLLILLLPKKNLNRWHCGTLISGLLIAWCLAARMADAAPPWLSIAMLAIPLCAAIVSTLFASSANDQLERTAGIILAMWFLSALALSFGGPRFVMLLVPSFAIAAGVFAGRIRSWLTKLASGFVPAATGVVGLILSIAMAALFIPAIAAGYRAARDYEPAMNSAWWDALSRIKAESPPDAIVYTPWDYGYWTKFVAERRVSADGGSLLTHIPVWFSQALLAPSEKETVGLLRMLSCGSDATPLPEADQGAYQKLLKYGIGEVAARDTILDLASLDRGAAAAYLSRLGLNQQGVDDVLTSTHCTPPPAYLILSSTTPRSRLLYSEPSYFQNADSSGSGTIDYLMDRWRLCVQRSPSELLCPLGVPINEKETVELFTFNTAVPRQSRIRVQVKKAGDVAAQEQERTPAMIWVIDAGGIRHVDFPSADEPGVGILVDVAQHMVLVGPQYLIRSTFTDLMFLDGRYSKAFDKTDERSGAHGKRVTTWRINWGQN